MELKRLLLPVVLCLLSNTVLWGGARVSPRGSTSVASASASATFTVRRAVTVPAVSIDSVANNDYSQGIRPAIFEVGGPKNGERDVRAGHRDMEKKRIIVFLGN